mgnify:CR=1 FL=1
MGEGGAKDTVHCDLRPLCTLRLLVAVKIEIHPFGRTAPLGAAEQAAIEGAGGGKVVHREGEVEGGEKHGRALDAVTEHGLS